jgi:perosamine synthetase
VTDMHVRLFRPRIREEAIEAAAAVLRSGWIGLGQKTAEFESAFAKYVGAPYCVGLNSCTSAIHLALHILDLPPGSEVITTPVTFVSTNHAILYENLTPVFADIQRTTGNLDPLSVESRLTDKTGAIMVMHYGGYPCDLDEFYAIGRSRNVAIIEDCAHASGARYRGKRIGSHEGFQSFSFHAVKNLPMGDGGALTVRTRDQYDRLRRLRWLGIDKDTYQRSEEVTRKAYAWDYAVLEVGFKYHMNDIEAAIGLEQLKCLDADNARRAQIAAAYRKQLAAVPGIELLDEEKDRQSSFHLCCILAQNRNALVDKLRRSGVEVGVHYKRNDSYPMYHLQELPNTEYFTSHAISLPLHLDLTDDEIGYVCSLLKEGW